MTQHAILLCDKSPDGLAARLDGRAKKRLLNISGAQFDHIQAVSIHSSGFWLWRRWFAFVLVEVKR